MLEKMLTVQSKDVKETNTMEVELEGELVMSGRWIYLSTNHNESLIMDLEW